MIFTFSSETSTINISDLPKLQSNCDYFILNGPSLKGDGCVEFNGPMEAGFFEHVLKSSLTLNKDIYIYKDINGLKSHHGPLKKVCFKEDEGRIFLTSNYKGLINLGKLVTPFGLNDLAHVLFSK